MGVRGCAWVVRVHVVVAYLLLLTEQAAEQALVLLTRERILDVWLGRLGLCKARRTANSLVQRRRLLRHFLALGFRLNLRSLLGFSNLLRRGKVLLL